MPKIKFILIERVFKLPFKNELILDVISIENIKLSNGAIPSDFL